FREVVHVEDGDALELGHSVQAVIVGHDRDAERSRERDELPVRARSRGVLLGELDLDGLLLLHLRKHLETAPPALATRAVRRVVEVLELGEYELRDDERSADKASSNDIRNAPVDDDRRV